MSFSLSFLLFEDCWWWCFVVDCVLVVGGDGYGYDDDESGKMLKVRMKIGEIEVE